MAGLPKNYASLLRARRAYLATTSPDGSADVIPVCFTWAGEAIWIAIDEDTDFSDQMVTFLVDRWDEDWTKLSWLVAKGRATILPEGPESDRALDALESKYAQFLKYPHYGFIMRVDIEDWQGADAIEAEPDDWA